MLYNKSLYFILLGAIFSFSLQAFASNTSSAIFVQQVSLPIGTSEQSLALPSGFAWQDVTYGSVPNGALIGGYANGSALYICHVDIIEGVHPGQLTAKGCLISYGGKAFVVNPYQILTGNRSAVWRSSADLASYGSSNNGDIPIVGGYEDRDRHPLYICRVTYDGDVHLGKVVSGNCNISVGDIEVEVATYEVLFSTNSDM